QALVGKGAAFERQQPIRIADFTDGASNTILIVEAESPIPWTKPEDLPFVADQALPKFGGVFQDYFNALFCDGSVRVLAKKTDVETLRALITRNGGEVVDSEKLQDPFDRSRGARLDAEQLLRENARLREAVKDVVREVAQVKEELELLKARVALGTPKIDKKAIQLLKENAELQTALEQALRE